MGTEIYHFKVGAFECIAINDFATTYTAGLEQAAAAKRRVFDRSAVDQSLVLAFHFHPFPSLGHVVRREAGWQWQPIDL